MDFFITQLVYCSSSAAASSFTCSPSPARVCVVSQYRKSRPHSMKRVLSSSWGGSGCRQAWFAGGGGFFLGSFFNLKILVLGRVFLSVVVGVRHHRKSHLKATRWYRLRSRWLSSTTSWASSSRSRVVIYRLSWSSWRRY